MSRLLPVVLIASTLVLGVAELPKSVMAGSCVAATSCGRQPVQFIPGQQITVQVVNLTASAVEVQQIYGTDPLVVNPGGVRSFIRGGSTDPNFSVVMWDATGLPLKVNILKPETRTLRIEVRPGGRPPGDRTVYLRDNGRVAIF